MDLTISSPFLHQTNHDTNHQTMHITLGREERAPASWLQRLDADRITDLMELVLNQFIMLVAICMIFRQDDQCLVILPLRDQPARTLRDNKKTNQLGYRETSLKKTSSTP